MPKAFSRFAQPRHPRAPVQTVCAKLPLAHVALVDSLASQLGVARAEVIRAGISLAIESGDCLRTVIGKEVLDWYRTRLRDVAP